MKEYIIDLTHAKTGTDDTARKQMEKVLREYVGKKIRVSVSILKYGFKRRIPEQLILDILEESPKTIREMVEIVKNKGYMIKPDGMRGRMITLRYRGLVDRKRIGYENEWYLVSEGE